MEGLRSLSSSLAPELLGEIFVNCLPATSRPISLDHAPLILCRVCGHWRRVAQATPRLWVDINIGTTTFELNPVRVFQLFLNNSGSLPLSIQLPQYNPRRSARSEKIINILLDNIHRMAEIRGFLTPWFAALLYQRKEDLPLHAPFLKLIELGGWDSEKLPHPEAVKELKECIVAPQLEKCHLRSTRFQLWVLSFDPTRLLELHGLWLVGLAQLQSLEFLSSLVNLEYLDIFIHAAADPSALQIPDSISIPSLRRLHIGTYPEFDADLFLKPLRMPRLQHLSISSFPKEGSVIAPVFAALFDDKDILRLQSLCISGYHVGVLDYLTWIHIFDDLDTLELGNSSSHPGIFTAMSTVVSDLNGNTRWLFPKLSTFVVNHLLIPSWSIFHTFLMMRTCALGTPQSDGQFTAIRKVTFRNYDKSDRSQSFPLANINKAKLEDIRFLMRSHFEIILIC